MFKLHYFQKSLGGIGADKDNDLDTFKILEDLYSRSNRFYHNQGHISYCLSKFQKYRHLADFPYEVEIAIWFHDAIYDTTSTDNEEKSTELAQDKLSVLNVNVQSIDRIVEMILATKSHQAFTIDSKLMIDIDLLILGASTPIFEKYDRNIRKEYTWVPQEVYLPKRIEVLQSFLDRNVIYQTQEIREQCETKARNNISKKIEELSVNQ